MTDEIKFEFIKQSIDAGECFPIQFLDLLENKHLGIVCGYMKDYLDEEDDTVVLVANGNDWLEGIVKTSLESRSSSSFDIKGRSDTIIKHYEGRNDLVVINFDSANYTWITLESITTSEQDILRYKMSSEIKC